LTGDISERVRREHERRRLELPRAQFGPRVAPRPVLGQDAHRRHPNGDAAREAGLRCLLHRSPGDGGDGALDQQRRVVEIDVVPPQAARFAAPAAGPRHQGEQRPEVRIVDQRLRNERAYVLGSRWLERPLPERWQLDAHGRERRHVAPPLRPRQGLTHGPVDLADRGAREASAYNAA
jgi:hypothetical protein